MAAPMKCMRCSFSKVIYAFNIRNASIVPSTFLFHSKSPSLLRCVSVGQGVSQNSSLRLYSSDAGANSDDEEKAKKKLNLAKPGKRQMKPKTGGDDFRSKMMKATEAVSEALGGDKDKTQTELLAALRSHITPKKDTETSTLTAEQAQETLKGLFSGIKVDEKKFAAQQYQRRTDGGEARNPRKLKDVELYSGSALGIFKEATQAQEYKPNFYDELEADEIRKKSKFPAANAFEEMIDWTKEGKLWKFPIDNEQGLDEEAKVGFHEHIFLEQFLEEGFPIRGPIRHFMDLVIVGLSKNPYLTVREKHEHIDWFRNYFKDKIEIVESLMAETKEGDSQKDSKA